MRTKKICFCWQIIALHEKNIASKRRYRTLKLFRAVLDFLPKVHFYFCSRGCYSRTHSFNAVHLEYMMKRLRLHFLQLQLGAPPMSPLGVVPEIGNYFKCGVFWRSLINNDNQGYYGESYFNVAFLRIALYSWVETQRVQKMHKNTRFVLKYRQNSWKCNGFLLCYTWISREIVKFVKIQRFSKKLLKHVDFTRNCQIRDNSTFFTMLDLSHVDFTRKILQSDSTISFKIKRVFEQL